MLQARLVALCSSLVCVPKEISASRCTTVPPAFKSGSVFRRNIRILCAAACAVVAEACPGSRNFLWTP